MRFSQLCGTVPVRAAQFARDEPHRWAACTSSRCRSLSGLSARVQAVHPDPADEPRANDQEGL